MIEEKPKKLKHKRALLVYNPKAGRGEASKIVRKFAIHTPTTLEILTITGKDAYSTVANLQKEVKEGDFVVAVGGDGLVNNLLQVLIGSGIPLFVFPAGTGNDFAKNHFKKPRSFNLVKLLSDSKALSIDTIKVNGNGFQKSFGQVLSAGFDSYVNAKANRLKYSPGSMKYVIALLLELPSFKPLDYRLKIDGNEENITAMMAVAANGNTYGGGMKVLPNADARDGLIDLLILNRVSKFELLRVFPKVFFGKHVTHPAVKIMRCKELEISSSAPIYADGEYFGTGPIKIEMAHNSLTIMSNR